MSSPSPVQVQTPQSMPPPPQPSPQPPTSQPNSVRYDQRSHVIIIVCSIVFISYINLIYIIVVYFKSMINCEDAAKCVWWSGNASSRVLLNFLSFFFLLLAQVQLHLRGDSSPAHPLSPHRAPPTSGPPRTMESPLLDRSTLQVHIQSEFHLNSNWNGSGR